MPRGGWGSIIQAMAKKQDTEKIRQQIAEFPKAPGVYLMKDTKGVVIYIGKARLGR